MACKRSAVRSRVAPPKPLRFSKTFIQSSQSIPMLKRLLSIVSFVIVSGCSSFSFESNLDPDNIVSYFELSKVKIYTNSELRDLNYEDIGTVEGISCKMQENEPEPTEKEAKADARSLALKKKGNGLVYSTCITLDDTPACLRSVSCYARVVYVKEDEEAHEQQ